MTSSAKQTVDQAFVPDAVNWKQASLLEEARAHMLEQSRMFSSMRHFMQGLNQQPSNAAYLQPQQTIYTTPNRLYGGPRAPAEVSGLSFIGTPQVHVMEGDETVERGEYPAVVRRRLH